jgi:hypothetical protein
MEDRRMNSGTLEEVIVRRWANADPTRTTVDSAVDARRWARRTTFALIALPSMLSVPSFMSCLAHSRVDSEVGVMMYGLPLVIGAMLGTPVVSLFTIIWGLGLKKAQGTGERIPLWELLCFGAITASLLLFLYQFSASYLHGAKSLVGL